MTQRRAHVRQTREGAPGGGRAASDYQRASYDYYRQMRELHSGVYASLARMEEEQSADRYTDVWPPKIRSQVRNLGSLVRMLRALCGPGPGVRGIDFGCGSHWFVDLVRNDPAYRWQAVGYDPDKLAIDMARKRFPRSAGFYRRLDPVREGLPQRTATQDFVFCNAVLQHFDDREADRALAEMARVLRPGGCAMLIFKRWSDALRKRRGGGGRHRKVLDSRAGKVLFLDPTMKEAIDALPPAKRAGLDEEVRRGWRLFHVFRVREVLDMAARHGLAPVSDVPLADGTSLRGEIRYRSGKRIPAACVVFRRARQRSD